MTDSSIFEADDSLSALLERTQKGEEVTITRDGKPIAKLVPLKPDPDRAAAIEAGSRLRALAKELALGPFDWEEWKRYRDEGRR